MSELEHLADLLNSKTGLGRIQWTVDDETRLHTIQGKNFIEIWKYRGETDHYIEITIRNGDGVVLAQDHFGEGNGSYDALNEVLTLVRRRSLGVDEALSDLRARLEAL